LLDEKAINEAKFKYAVAAYYKEFVYGNRGATPGERETLRDEESDRWTTWLTHFGVNPETVKAAL